MENKLNKPNYVRTNAKTKDNMVSIIMGFAIGFVILYLFYKIIIVAIIGGALMGFANIFVRQSKLKEKRLKNLRMQFFDMLEAMSVSMRAGNPPIKALESARKDLSVMYSPTKDIMIELDMIIGNFASSIVLSQSFADFAERSGLEDIATFASIYKTIEGKSSRADEIVREVQEIIADKASVEMEIDTLMTSTKNEMAIMFAMPLLILGLMGNMGGGFLDAIYLPGIGRIVATGGLIVYICCYFLGLKFAKIDV